MSALHTQVFAAVHALPKPVTPEQATAAGLEVIQAESPGEQQQWTNWMATNGAQLCVILNNTPGA